MTVVKISKRSLKMIFGHYCGNLNCITCKQLKLIPKNNVKK